MWQKTKPEVLLSAQFDDKSGKELYKVYALILAGNARTAWIALKQAIFH